MIPYPMRRIYQDSFVERDVNGDGFSDLVLKKQQKNLSKGWEISVYPSTGESFGSRQLVGDCPRDCAIGLGDVNGDGIADRIIAKRGQVTVALGTGGDYENSRVWLASGYPGAYADGGGSMIPYPMRRIYQDSFVVRDVNGDGFGDLVLKKQQKSWLREWWEISVYLSTGGSFGSQQVVVQSPADSAIGLGDVNGDGIADRIIAARGGSQSRAGQPR